MTPPSFHHLVDEYLTARRGLGFELEAPEWLLRNFASYAERLGHSGPMTIELAIQWARTSRSSNPAQAARRLVVVRQSARYCALFDPATEVPPVGLLGRIPRRPPPHIYTEAEMAALLQQASCLRPPTRAATRHLCRVPCPADLHRSAAFRVLPPDDRRGSSTLKHHQEPHLPAAAAETAGPSTTKSCTLPVHGSQIHRQRTPSRLRCQRADIQLAKNNATG